jgi:hypothetical protein
VGGESFVLRMMSRGDALWSPSSRRSRPTARETSRMVVIAAKGSQDMQTMSSEGREAAAAHAQTLPQFRSLAEAQAALIAKKNSRIASLLSEAAASPKLVLDFSVESLLRLEQWHFDRIRQHAADPKQLAESCAFYFGEVVVRTIPGAHWVVEEFVLSGGVTRLAFAGDWARSCSGPSTASSTTI